MDWSAVHRATTLSLPDRLSVDLERMILEGDLAPGEKLPAERELAEHFGVSRASVRDALRELEKRGLIDRRPGRGTLVLDPAARAGVQAQVLGEFAQLEPELQHIIELRAIIEPPAAALTAQRATARDLAQLRELLAAMDQTEDGERYAQLDRVFHQSIAQYSHNPRLALVNDQLVQQAEPIRARRYLTRARRVASTAAHRKIYDAIAAGNAELAEQAARAHVEDISRQLARAGETD